MVEITYHKEGDYFVPDLYLEKENYENDEKIGNVVIKLQNKELKNIDIFIKKKEKKSFFQKIEEWFKNLW